MQKTSYQKELLLSATQSKGGTQNTKKEVQKIQSWLCLQEMLNHGIGTYTAIDGDFGPATARAVENFQIFKGLPSNGIVDSMVFNILSQPLRNAFEGGITSTSIRSAILEIGEMHLSQSPFELLINSQTNSGPWVRSYMDKNEGDDWLWCMGFVQAIIDQAFSAFGKNFKNMMPLTYSCDTIGITGINKNVLLRNSAYKNNPTLIKRGDIFLIRKSQFDWIHTGIIVEIGSDIFTTIEGNSNIKGSRNGIGVYKRVRNFKKNLIDVFSIENWVH